MPHSEMVPAAVAEIEVRVCVNGRRLAYFRLDELPLSALEAIRDQAFACYRDQYSESPFKTIPAGKEPARGE